MVRWIAVSARGLNTINNTVPSSHPCFLISGPGGIYVVVRWGRTWLCGWRIGGGIFVDESKFAATEFLWGGIYFWAFILLLNERDFGDGIGCGRKWNFSAKSDSWLPAWERWRRTGRVYNFKIESLYPMKQATECCPGGRFVHPFLVSQVNGRCCFIVSVSSRGMMKCAADLFVED